MLRRSGVLATLILALTVTPAYATTVTLRVEGKDTTIFEGPVVTGPKTIEEDGSHACDGTRESNGGETDQPRGTATTALDDGARVNGFSWDGTFSEFGSFRDYFVTRIGGDTQKTDLNEFWGFARNYELPPVGGCQQQVFDGRVGRGGSGDRAAVTAHAGDPEDVDDVQGSVRASAKASQTDRGVGPENCARVGHRLKLQILSIARPFMRHRLAVSSRSGGLLCVWYIYMAALRCQMAKVATWARNR